MKAANITHVLIFPMGQWNPETRTLVWDRTDYLIEKIAGAGMRFIPLLLKEQQCSHYFPIWLFREIPGLWEEYCREDGGNNTRENVDFADPRIFPFVETYFASVIGRYKDHPALAFYNVWNEPHYRSSAPHVRNRFREWLKNRYGSLAVLRKMWAEEYTGWEQVSPFLGDNWDSSMPQIDWILFQNDFKNELLDRLNAIVRTYDTIHPVTSNPVGTPLSSFMRYGGWACDNWSIAERNDFHGISYYPDSWERHHEHRPFPRWRHALTFTAVRCASAPKNYLLTELYTNVQNGLALDGYLDYSDIHLLAWTALAHGCKGMVYWKWLPFGRGRQSLGRGLCRIDGTLAPRGKAVADFGAVIRRHGGLLYRAKPVQAQTAILVDINGFLKATEQTAEKATAKFVHESVAGTYQALWERNIAVDIIRMDRNLDREMLDRYRILFLPCQLVMRQAVASHLREFVRKGGWLVADARTATLNEFDFAFEKSPGAGLDTLFDAVRIDWRAMAGEYIIKMVNDTDGNDRVMRGKYFRDMLATGKEASIEAVFVDNGEPALVSRRLGKGTAVLSAIPLGGSYYDDPKNPVGDLPRHFCRRAGVRQAARFSGDRGGFVETTVHEFEDGVLVYLINGEKDGIKGTVEIDIEQPVENKAVDLVTGTAYPAHISDGRVSVALSIKGKRAAAVLLKFARL
jgi:beta-galactosidase